MDVNRTMEWTGLNVFQRLTRHWDSLHPYNAAQAMKLAGPADRKRLASSWHATITAMGLGNVRVDGARFRYHELDDASRAHLLDVPAGISFEQLMSIELNRRFDDTSELPFRAFAVDAGGDHYLGIVYHHWVADSFSIRLLLREWFLRMYDQPAARRGPLHIADEGYWRLFGPEQANWSIGSGALGIARWGARFRHARRIEPKGFGDFRVNFTLHHAPSGLIQSIVPAARRLGVTVNDLFLAAMAQVCDELVPLQRSPRRPDLALGTIVDLRSRARTRMDDVFGLFLGFTSIFCRPGELKDVRRLLRCVNQQNAMQKQSAAAEASMMRMLAGLVVARMFGQKRLLEFYRKRLALAGGISNVNLNRDWPAKYYSSRPRLLLDYVRVSPCGPMMPVVFTPTTIGDSLNFGLTCRDSVVPPSLSPQLAGRFIERLQELAQVAASM
jgi:hypothetical protein